MLSCIAEHAFRASKWTRRYVSDRPGASRIDASLIRGATRSRRAPPLWSGCSVLVDSGGCGIQLAGSRKSGCSPIPGWPCRNSTAKTLPPNRESRCKGPSAEPYVIGVDALATDHKPLYLRYRGFKSHPLAIADLVKRHKPRPTARARPTERSTIWLSSSPPGPAGISRRRRGATGVPSSAKRPLSGCVPPAADGSNQMTASGSLPPRSPSRSSICETRSGG